VSREPASRRAGRGERSVPARAGGHNRQPAGEPANQVLTSILFIIVILILLVDRAAGRGLEGHATPNQEAGAGRSPGGAGSFKCMRLLGQRRERCKSHSMTRNGTPSPRGVGAVKCHKSLRHHALDSDRPPRARTRAIRKSGFPVPFFRATLKPWDGDYFDAVSSNSEAI
jgi:hypothetical protein